MADTIIHRGLLLQQQLHMLLLQSEGERKPLNCKRNLLWIVVETEQIQSADECLHTPLELTNALLLSCIVLNNLSNDLTTDAQLLEEMHLPQGSGDQVVLGDDQLLLEIEAVDVDIVHAIAQNRVHALVVVMTEDKQTTAEIQVNATEVLVLKAIVLAAIRQVDQQVVDLLTLGRL